MSGTQFRCKPLSFAVRCAVIGMVPFFSLAQDDSVVKKADDKEIEKIEVIGMRGSVITSQELKRQANTVKDVISADDIGALPDKSVTEALMRVPGVTIERFASSEDPNHFAAEGTGVVVRGLDRVRSEINGRDAFSASTGGGLSYEDIPGELLGHVEVVKNQTADLIAGGVAGTVNLVTRKPFDSEGFFGTASIKGSYGDHREEWTPIGSVVVSNRWTTDVGDFGALLAASSSDYKDRGDGVALGNYYERSATAREMPQFGNFGTELPNYRGQTKYVPADASIRSADSERDRRGLAGSLQFRNTDKTLEVVAEYIRSKAGLSWDERVIQQGEQGFNVSPNQVQVANATFDSKNFMTAGTLLMNNRSLAQTRWRDTEQVVEDSSVRLIYSPIEKLKLEFDYQHIESSYDVVDYTINNSFENNDLTFDITGSKPMVDFLGKNLTSPLAPAPFSEMYLNSAMDKEDDTDAEADSFAVDGTYQLDHKWLTSFQFGAYASTKEQIKRDSIWNWGEMANGTWQRYADGGQRTAYTGTTAVPGHPELYETYTFNANNFHGGGVLGRDQSILFARIADIRNWQDYHRNNKKAGFATFTQLRDRSCVTLKGKCELDGAYLPSEISSSKEERREFYSQLNYENNDLAYPIRGNVGLRYVSWQVESSGATQFPNPIPSWDTGTQAMYTAAQLAYQNALNTDIIHVKGEKYTKVLPSFNISMELADDHITRFAISQNIFLPNFENFRYFRTISESHTSPRGPNGEALPFTNIGFDGVSGNPKNIEPEEALSIDATYEWYISTSNSLTFSVFRKELKNLIRQRLYTENVTNDLAKVTMPVNFQTDTNEGSGTLQGFEIAYTQFFDQLPGLWSGLGIQTNYTFIDQSNVDDKVGFGTGSGGAGGRNRFRAFNNLPLPGFSEDTLNLTAMYEKNDLSARLAWNWRSDYLLTRRDADLFAPVIAEPTGQLDMSVGYHVTPSIKIGLEATNLLDEIIKTKLIYNQAGDTTLRNQFKTDRRLGVYVSAKF